MLRPSQGTGCISCASGDKGPIWWDTRFKTVDSEDGSKRTAEQAELEERVKRFKAEDDSDSEDSSDDDDDGGGGPA